MTKVPEGHLVQKWECMCCPSSWRTELRCCQRFSVWSQPLAAPGTGPGDRVHTGSCSGACAPRPQVCVALVVSGFSAPQQRPQCLLAHTRSSPAGCTRGHREAGAAHQAPCPPALLQELSWGLCPGLPPLGTLQVFLPQLVQPIPPLKKPHNHLVQRPVPTWPEACLAPGASPTRTHKRMPPRPSPPHVTTPANAHAGTDARNPGPACWGQGGTAR